MKKLFILVFWVAACDAVQDFKGPLQNDVDKDASGINTLTVDSNITLFGTVRGVFTARDGAVCIDRLTPSDVWPLISRIKDPNSPMPAGIPTEVSKGGVNIEIHNDNSHKE